MFGLEYTRVQVLVQLVGKQRYVDFPHKKNRPGVTIQQLKLMAKRSLGGGWAGLIAHSRTVRDSTKVAPVRGEADEWAEGSRAVKAKCPAGPGTLYIASPVAKSKVEGWLHMGLGIMPTAWSYELFLDMQKGAGCNSVIMGLPWWLRRRKTSACNAETWVRSLGQEDPLEKEMETHSSILAWEIPWTEESGRLQSMGSQESDTT